MARWTYVPAMDGPYWVRQPGPDGLGGRTITRGGIGWVLRDPRGRIIGEYLRLTDAKREG